MTSFILCNIHFMLESRQGNIIPIKILNIIKTHTTNVPFSMHSFQKRNYTLFKYSHCWTIYLYACKHILLFAGISLCVSPNTRSYFVVFTLISNHKNKNSIFFNAVPIFLPHWRYMCRFMTTVLFFYISNLLDWVKKEKKNYIIRLVGHN